MAIKMQTNAEELSKFIGLTISTANLEGWAQSGIRNAVEGTDGNWMPFSYFVARHYLSGQYMNVGEEDARWEKYRGWHHRDCIESYRPKGTPKGGKVYEKVGMYHSQRKAGGGQSRSVPLNYITRDMGTKAYGYIADAWSKFKGTTKTKDDMSWMVTHGIEKKAKEANLT